jgi:hypothetical protein
LKRLVDLARERKVFLISTVDAHTADDPEFRRWPPHCVQGARGAEFHPDLVVPASATVISKGDDPDKEAYSGFQGTDLAKRLKARKWPKQKIWENVESELVDLSLYESVRFLGPRRVYQIDCTGKSPAQMLQKALRLLSAKQAWDGQTPDWLGRHDPIELSRSIL